MRSKFSFIFLVLYLSWTIGLVDSATRTRVRSSASEEDEDGGSRERPLLGQVEGASALRSASSSMSEKRHGHRVENKLRHFVETAEYDQFYSEAFRAYKGDPSSVPVQLVDQHGNFMTVPRKIEALEEEGAEGRRAQGDLVKLMAALKGIAGKGYLVVSVFGHQSTGKSYLMNQVFGTEFGIKEHSVISQFTRGVWLARSPELPNLLIVDCEGTGGAQKIEQGEKEAAIAEYGMVYSMLVSQLVIFNLDFRHLDSAEHETMFINTLEHYMNNKVKGSPPLRVIVCIRNVLGGSLPSTLRKYATKIVEQAFTRNKRKGDEDIRAYFDLHYFWFGQFKVREDLDPADVGYEHEEVYENHDVLGKVKPFFVHRLALFKRRFTVPEDPGYYLKDLAPLMTVDQLPSFLHQLWDSVNGQKGVALENVLSLTMKTRLAQAAEGYARAYEHKFRQLIDTQANKAPGVVGEALLALTEPAEKEYSIILGDMVPSYAAPLAEEHTEKLLAAVQAINLRLTPILMRAMADHAAGILPAEARELLKQNTHAKELEAIALFTVRQEAIQALCPRCPPQEWAGALRLAEQQIAHAAAQKQEARVDAQIQQGLEAVHGEDGHGDLVAGVTRLAQTIAGPEELDMRDVENKIASAYHLHIAHFGHRKNRVKAVFDRHYSLGQHIAGGDDYFNPILAQARTKKDQLVAFRRGFHGRIHFPESEQTWREGLEEYINDFERDNKDRRDLEFAKMEASYKESSLRYALGFLMLYQIVTDYSLTLLMFWTFIFFLAMSGMLGPQIFDPARWIALPGYVATSVGFLINGITTAYRVGLPMLQAAGVGNILEAAKED